MKKAYLIIGTLTVLTMSLGYHSYNLKRNLDSQIVNTRVRLEAFSNRIDIIKANYEEMLQMRDTEIDNLNLALDTAFNDNQVIKTLLNQEMEDWTVEGVLAMREQLDSVPYGSWFESGHYVTGAFGSTLLTGTYWGKDGHRGVDTKPLSNNPYELIISPIAGRVITWGRNDRLFGNYLVIESLDGMFQIKLAHLSSIAIFEPDGKYDLYEGMEFPSGSRIARMGATGRVTGAHLHTEYYIKDSTGWRLLNASAILDYMGE